jgi:hypothetical protein
MINSLEDRWGDQLNFVYLDVDDPATSKLRRDLHYRSTQLSEPQFFLLDEAGKTLKSWIGVVESAELEEAFRAALD